MAGLLAFRGTLQLMKHRRKVLIIGGLAIWQSLSSKDSALKIGGRPPEYSLLGKDGKVHNLSDYKGKALVINFWSTFCPPCVIEMPEFQRKSNKWKSEPFEIIGDKLKRRPVNRQ